MISKNTFSAILDKNGPDQLEFELIDQLCQSHPEILKQINKKDLSFLVSSESIMGHILNKPFGYAGDFKIIDRIYTKDASDEFRKWDDYSLSNSAAKAVRNRKDYFKLLIKEKLDQKGALNVLNIACGPARDVFEIFEEIADSSNLTFTCLDLDENAIEYAKELNEENSDKITFIHKNILKFDTDSKYDLIWSAGLFDYFNDKAFVTILNRMGEWMDLESEIVIGNFNEDHNPSRNYMEIIGEWFLKHRSIGSLESLALEAGYDKTQIKVNSEPENVNLFLHVKADANLSFGLKNL
ncbi:class I SAM-dependent methyltransferase [Aureibacter tunicatorum]|uniref:SAM-dependent methyltransferase n=1 Tax=Aureibacter tunicatorum TaxID=866807 RepID=A0AAE4BSW1_9BACT|nr:class I SAM-dependent methyltransferase [Aureibacter tunicatorum]MDR6239305.1 SAM-dependent methyltransferase [Aureibacter tunicatorum]BDD04771.1 hypothetical protein AUTU_22540 [Aureibacter tunicatorum]